MFLTWKQIFLLLTIKGSGYPRRLLSGPFALEPTVTHKNQINQNQIKRLDKMSRVFDEIVKKRGLSPDFLKPKYLSKKKIFF